MTDMTMDDLTPENLDRIAKALQQDKRPDDDYHAQWCAELGRRLKAVCDMFDAEEDASHRRSSVINSPACLRR